MLTYSFSERGSEPIYLYLYDCIKNDIVNGQLKAEEKLPSKRAFAKNLGISVITIENTYEMLSAEGYIYSLPKKGYFVSDIKEIAFENAATADNGNGSANSEKDANNVFLISQQERPHFLCDFASNQTEADLFPFSVWSHLMREELSKDHERLMENPPSGGVIELRKAIAKHLKEFRNMSVSPEQIIIGAGTEYLIGLLIQLLGFDRTFAIEDPGYGKISRIYESHHIKCVFLPIKDKGIEEGALEKNNVDIVHISPSHQYPLGVIMPISKRYGLLTWAAGGENRYIIEDDFDSELRFNGKPIPTMYSIDSMNKVIYMNTFTKTLSSTIRISYMVLPEPLLKKYYERLFFYACTVSNFEQYTLARFIDEGYFENHINRMRNHYRKKREFLINEIKGSRLYEKVNILEEEAGLHFLIEVKSKKTEDEIISRADKCSVRLRPLSSFYRNRENAKKNVYLINYSSANEEALSEAVHILEKIL